jgi:hypothetical protein
LGNAAAQGELLNYVLEPLATSGTYNGAAALYAQRCGLPLPPDFSPSPPFTGGQCPVQYTVVVGWNFVSNGMVIPPENTPQSGAVLVTGAIQGAEIRRSSGGYQVGAVGASGFSQASALSGNPDANGLSLTNPSIISVTRVDGLPDTCGNPNPTYPSYQPGDNSVTENVTVINNEGDTLTIPVVLVFGYATLNIDGTVSIPVNADFTLNPEFNGNFDFNLNTGDLKIDVSNPAAPRPSPCTDPGGYNVDVDIPEPPASIPDAPGLPPPDTEPAERQKLLRGCIVTTQLLDGNETIIFQESNPDIYVPSLGYVQFLVRVGGASAWTNDIPVKCLRTFIPCPWDGGAVDVKGTPRYGNQFVVTPVYVTRTFNPTYPPES